MAGRKISLRRWVNEYNFSFRKFQNIKRLVRLKKQKGIKISVCIPTLNEEKTVGRIIHIIKSYLMQRYPLVDEILVIDSGSTDNTKKVAKKAGAKFYTADRYLPKYGKYYHKGENLWKALYLAKGDIIVYVDADIRNFHARFVYGLVGPVLEDDKIGYVKAYYKRPIIINEQYIPQGGGRTTWIVVKPMFNLFFPQLVGFIQPLSGEYAGRRKVLERVPFSTGYGVETGLLIDIYKKFGFGVMAQVDMLKREHRNQTITALARQSFAILQTFFKKISEHGYLKLKEEYRDKFSYITRTGKLRDIKTFHIEEIERPPMIEIPEYLNKFRIRN
ncbi:glucosyl-3-phosphoglycerate synthase [Candidatus Woesearchaeota archaeon]|nr:glucosyl-3-phosphoglycerate synthase [Candidatus Woesearchaeota archaeon]